ncbi:MAG TPA: ACT domain-containing protein [Arenimonas sp.]|nr:ACT domain-containing protein [Arenimonas sp.]
MKQRIECEIDRAEGSLIRVLGVIERRGYDIEALSVSLSGRDAYRLAFTVESARDMGVLLRQLERLFDVRCVQRQLPEPAQAQKPPEAVPMPGFQASWLAG